MGLTEIDRLANRVGGMSEIYIEPRLKNHPLGHKTRLKNLSQTLVIH